MTRKLVACVDPKVTKRREDAELVTLDCKITLTRGEWAGAMHAVRVAMICDAIGMASAEPRDKVMAQIIAQHAPNSTGEGR